MVLDDGARYAIGLSLLNVHENGGSPLYKQQVSKSEGQCDSNTGFLLPKIKFMQSASVIVFVTSYKYPAMSARSDPSAAVSDNATPSR